MKYRNKRLPRYTSGSGRNYSGKTPYLPKGLPKQYKSGSARGSFKRHVLPTTYRVSKENQEYNPVAEQRSSPPPKTDSGEHRMYSVGLPDDEPTIFEIQDLLTDTEDPEIRKILVQWLKNTVWKPAEVESSQDSLEPETVEETPIRDSENVELADELEGATTEQMIRDGILALDEQIEENPSEANPMDQLERELDEVNLGMGLGAESEVIPMDKKGETMPREPDSDFLDEPLDVSDHELVLRDIHRKYWGRPNCDSEVEEY